MNLSHSRKRICTVFLGLVAWVASISVMAVEVGSIVVKSTSNAIPQLSLDAKIYGTIATQIGREFNPATLSEDIKKLVKSGEFEDVRTNFGMMPNGKIEVTYLVSPKPIVRGIVFEGNSEYKSSRLSHTVKHEVGIPLDENQLAKDRNALLERYRNAGYFGTEVHSLRRAREDGSGVDIVFVIKEEHRRKLKKVYFEGNTVFTQGELRKSIVTQRQWWRYILRFGNWFNGEMQAMDKDKLKTLYGTKGYMDFSVPEVKIRPVDDGKWVEVTYVINEGQPYTVTDITLAGSKRFSAEELLKLIKTRVGDVHDSTRENTDTDLMKAKYEQLGYLEMRLWPTYAQDREKHTVAVNYHVQEGDPSHIRRIEITGNERTRDEVIRRELAIAPTDLSDNGKIRTSRRRLQNMGYFDSVEILPVATEDPNLRDLRIELREKATGSLSLGAGFSTEDSAIGFIEFTETNFDLARLLGAEWPPKGGGQRLRSRIQIDDDVSQVGISLTEPWFLERRLELTTEIFLRRRDEDEYEQRNVGFGQMLSWPVIFRVPWTNHTENWRLGIGYRVEHIRISDVDEHDESTAMEDGDFVKDHCIKDEKGTYWANRLIFRATRDTRDAFRFPTRGSIISLQSEYVTEALGSYESYGRFQFEASKYIPFYQDLVLKLDANYYTTTGDDDIAIFDRYFAGGIGTVRGFKRRDVAPVDRFDDPIGGNSMFTASIEVIKPVSDFMFVSAFVDGGTVWWDDFKADISDFNYSVGFGVQFRAIPISVYYGYPIHTEFDHLDGKSGRLHFTIGLSY